MQKFVTFVGYAARVIDAEKREHAVLDFANGAAMLNLAGVGVLVADKSETSEVVAEVSSRLSEFERARRGSFGENQIVLDPNVDAHMAVERFQKQYRQLEEVLRQADIVGSRFSRISYEKYMEETIRTGIVRVDVHAVGRVCRSELKLFEFPATSALVVERNGGYQVFLAGEKGRLPSVSPSHRQLSADISRLDDDIVYAECAVQHGLIERTPWAKEI